MRRRTAARCCSRVADSIYWMSRYIERAENVARFIDVNLNLHARPAARRPRISGSRSIDTTRRHRGLSRALRQRHADSVIEFLTFDTGEPELDLSCLRARARTRARCARSSRRRCGSRSTTSTC